MKTFLWLLLLLTIQVVVGMFLIIGPFAAGDKDACADSSQTIGQYNLCKRFESCDNLFSGPLYKDCIQQIVFDALR